MDRAIEIIFAIEVAILALTSFRRTKRLRTLNDRVQALCGIKASLLMATHEEGAFRAALKRSGIALEAGAHWQFGLLAGAVFFAATLFVGWLWGAVATGVLVAIGLALVRRRNDRRSAAFRDRLPEFLERVRRMTMTGSTFQHAFVQVGQASDSLIADQVGPAIRRVKLGMSFPVSIEILARDTQIIELHMLAAYVRSNTKFGGRVSESLASLIDQINNRRRLDREIRAATAETRASAAILAGLTALVIAVTSILNPDYPHFFFSDPTGRWVLAGIVGWPLIGAVVMKRILAVEY